MEGVALDRPLDPAVLSRLKKFSAMNKLKKIAIRVSFLIPEILKICARMVTVENLGHTSMLYHNNWNSKCNEADLFLRWLPDLFWVELQY